MWVLQFVVQIASLRRTNTALRARASHLHTRLLTALDTLDSLQSNHASELNVLHDANAALERRLSSVAELLKETIDERDDLRDAVERFIEKC
jgi:chromosome segregation ATPase